MDVPGIRRDELEDAGRFRDLFQDIEFELSKFGKFKEIVIIRSSDVCPTIPSTAIGKIFVRFEEVASAFGVYNLLNGRYFANQAITTTFYSEDKFSRKELE